MTDTTAKAATGQTRDETEPDDACVDQARDRTSASRSHALAHLDADDLTAQERRIARRLLRGNGPKQIACAMGISPRTVYWHQEHVYRKTGSHSLGEFFAWAYRHRDCCGFAEFFDGRPA